MKQTIYRSLTAAMSPAHDLITIVHVHSGAESYSIPDRNLLLKQDIYEHGVIRKDHIYGVDMVFVDSDTVAIGGAESILTFSNVRTGNKHDSISAPVLRDASSCSLRRLVRTTTTVFLSRTLLTSYFVGRHSPTQRPDFLAYNRR